MTKKVILDCDPGIDDALAIIFAIKAGLDLRGIIAGHGNSSSLNSAKNAKGILKLLNREDIPVVMGQHLPIRSKDKIEAGYVHGLDGLGNTGLPYESEFDERSPTELMMGVDGTFKLIITGPSTSLYYALRENPSLINRIEELYLMGGAAREGGNISSAAEFNFYADPESANYCLQLPIKKTIIGLDVTHKVILTPALLERILEKDSNINKFIGDIVKHYHKFYMGELGFNGCPLHDPLTVGYLLRPDLFWTEEVNARVETEGKYSSGELILERRPNNKAEKNANICTDVKATEFIEYFIETLKS